MASNRILYVCQEVAPYVPDTEGALLCRRLSQAMQERGNEIRTFMPRYGCINERRHQLHEVIRLSGMNLIIDDNDHQLIIKVASIPSARVQIYFIDNDDYFARKAILRDADENYFEDNDERAIFFARGVLETVKKLRWTPTVVHFRATCKEDHARCGENGGQFGGPAYFTGSNHRIGCSCRKSPLRRATGIPGAVCRCCGPTR